MKFKRISIFLMTAAILLTMSACNNNSTEAQDETTTVNELITENLSSAENELISENTVATVETTILFLPETTTAEQTTVNKDDPSEWSKSKIVDYYKQAAINSSAVKSKQTMSLADIKFNDGDGAINGMFKLIKPVITGILAGNSTEFDGITGGYLNIVETDIATAEAYAVGENIVIEMTMIEQTDGAHGDRYSGTVGHCISVVGDISTVLDMLKDAGISANVSDEGISMTYTKPQLKVLIGSDGKIVNGTWSYNVDLQLSNYSVGSVTVDKTSVVIDYIITVDGGFGV